MDKKDSEILKCYGKVFSKPQFSHFKAYILGLTTCEIPSISRMSHLHIKSRSSMNRFLTESPWEIRPAKSVYHKQIKPFIERGSSLLIDDTISNRLYAKKVEKVNYHYDHTTNTDVLGYSIVTSAISSGGDVIPYNLIPYYREEDCELGKFKTKNEIAVEIIKSTADNPKITVVIFDTWYSNEIVIGACKRARKNYITQIKSNRNVTINQHKNAVRAFTKYIAKDDWQFTVYKNSMFKFFETSAFISKIRSVHLIFCQKYDNSRKKWGKTHFIISNMLNITSHILLHRYLQRVGIEGFHRDAKQNLGLEGYFLRKNRGIERYLFLVLVACGMLIIKNMRNKLNLSIGELCEEQKFSVYLQAYDLVEQSPHLKEPIFRNLAKARV